jgi:hypothetical protein
VDRKLLIGPLLILGLLLQAAAAQADRPCVSDSNHHATTAPFIEMPASTAHEHHAMHAPSMDAASEAQSLMDCCADGATTDCVVSGCVSATPAVPTVSSAQPLLNRRATTGTSVYRLVVYVAPPDGIFRPPIA